MLKRHHKLIFGAILIFLFAFSLRVITLNVMGRTWDENEYVTDGYNMDELLIKGNFSSSYFYTTYDHPPLAKYIYGIPAHLDLKSLDKSGNPTFHYNLTYSRLLSSIFGSLSAVLVFLMAWEYVSPFVGSLSGIIFSALPVFIGLSQLVTTESILMFLFTGAIYGFIKLIDRISPRKVVFVGVLAGLAVLAKQSNLLLFPLFIFIYLIWYLNFGKQHKLKFLNKSLYSILWITLIAIITFMALWPMAFFHLNVINRIDSRLWLTFSPPPVIFWGKLILSPVIYYITIFFITTPLLVIVAALIGLKAIDNKKNWILYAIVFWFCFPFIQSFYPFRANGIRYIVEIYAPLSIIAGIGIGFIVEKLKVRKNLKLGVLLLTVMYVLVVDAQIQPYYLDYFNALVGGIQGVYKNQYFEIGWWGEGLGEAGNYLKRVANKGSTVGLAVSPALAFPQLNDLKVSTYSANLKFDYVVVNYFHVLRDSFNDSQIKKNYKLIHQVMAGGAPLVDIYSSK